MKNVEFEPKLLKVCSCEGFQTEDLTYKFCPMCKKKLVSTRVEKDGTLHAERKRCMYLNQSLYNKETEEIECWYKVSPLMNDFVYLYENEDSERFFIGCHISKIKPLDDDEQKEVKMSKNSNPAITLGQFIDLIDRNRDQGDLIHFMDDNGNTTASISSNSPLLIPNYDKIIDSVAATGDSVFEVWLSDEEEE